MEHDRDDDSKSSFTATLMIHVNEFEKCHDCTESLTENLSSADLITGFEKQRIQVERTQIEKNRYD